MENVSSIKVKKIKSNTCIDNNNNNDSIFPTHRVNFICLLENWKLLYIYIFQSGVKSHG